MSFLLENHLALQREALKHQHVAKWLCVSKHAPTCDMAAGVMEW
jgi:hypothetical protein